VTRQTPRITATAIRADCDKKAPCSAVALATGYNAGMPDFPTLLVVGAGDVARRALPRLTGRYRVLVVHRRAEQAAMWRALGALPIHADLDDRASLERLAGLADCVLYTAPPDESASGDSRVARLANVLKRRASIPRRIVYISTSGVYGDRHGAPTPETVPCRPDSARGMRRLTAERLWRQFARQTGASVTILRAPGIYAGDRLPLARLRAGTPCAIASEDTPANRIHADDLALLCVAALERRGGIRCYNVCDDSQLATGEWLDAIADRYRLARPPRLPHAELATAVSPAQWSFLRESRLLLNARMHAELAVALRYPTLDTFLVSADATIELVADAAAG